MVTQTVNILPSRFNISVRQGDTVRICFSFFDDAGDPLDLSDIDLIFNLYLGGTDVFSLTTDDAMSANGILERVVTVDNNRIDLIIPASRTAMLNACRYIFAITMLYSNDDVRTAIEGDFIVAKTGSTVLGAPTGDVSVTIYNSCGGALDTLNALSEYTDDDAAILDGLSAGDWYVVAAGSDIAAPGTLKKIL